MGHEITFQEVTGGGSSDVKPIEINVGAALAPRTEYERGLVRGGHRIAPGTPLDRSRAHLHVVISRGGGGGGEGKINRAK